MHYKIVLVVNPVAGRGLALHQLPAVTKKFDELSLHYEVVLTERAGHAVEIARNAGSRGYTAIVASGGDGTCNEIINGLMRSKKNECAPTPVLSVLPFGRRNDFAFAMGIPSNIDDACRVLRAGRVFPFDVGFVSGDVFPQGRYFGNSVVFGVGAVLANNERHYRRLRGSLPRFFGTLETFVSYPRPESVGLSIDGRQTTCETQYVSVLNGPRQNGAFVVAPDADTLDGFFDVRASTIPLSRGKMLSLMARRACGDRSKTRGLLTTRGKSLSISAPSTGIACAIDGEILSSLEGVVSIECLNGSLSVICDPNLPASPALSPSAPRERRRTARKGSAV